MNRTRSLFYVILALFLAIIATSLAFNVIDARFLTQFFIGASVFSVGVVALDFLGIFGEGESGHGDGDGGGLHGDFHTGDTGADFGGDGDVGGDGGDDGGGDEFDFDHDGSPAHMAGHLEPHGSPVLSVLAYLRMAVYFFLGFGPTGWVALVTGRTPFVALALAVPMGVLATLAAQAFFRLQRSNTDSTVERADLVNEAALVTVSLTDKDMGKVRIKTGMAVMEQYALAANPGGSFQKGATVRIVKVTPECVYVD